MQKVSIRTNIKGEKMLKGFLFTLSLLSISSAAISYPYFTFATKSSKSFHGIEKDTNVKVVINTTEAWLKNFLNTAIKEYFHEKGVVITPEAAMELTISCLPDEINEPFSFTEVVPVASGNTSLPIYHTKTIDGMRTVKALKCEGRISKDSELWHFLVGIPNAFVPDFEKRGLDHVSKLFEYQGVGHVNLETGEVH